MAIKSVKELNNELMDNIFEERLKEINEAIETQYKNNVRGFGGKFVCVKLGDEIKDEIIKELEKAGYSVEETEVINEKAFKVSW